MDWSLPGARGAPCGLASAAVLLVVSSAGTAWALDSAPIDPASREASKLGLTLGVSYHSAFVWRGINYYANPQADSKLAQMTNYGSIEPYANYKLPGTPVTLGYWSGYQTNGDNVEENIASANGFNQQLDAACELDLIPEQLSLTPHVFYYFYPLSSAEAAGSAFASYLESSASLEWTGAFVVDATVSYLTGLQHGLDYQFAYLNVAVSRDFEISETLTLGLGAAYGLKVWTIAVSDSIHDIQLDATWGIAQGGFGLTPGIHWAWTDYDLDADGNAVSFDREHVLWGSLDVAYEL